MRELLCLGRQPADCEQLRQLARGSSACASDLDAPRAVRGVDLIANFVEKTDRSRQRVARAVCLTGGALDDAKDRPATPALARLGRNAPVVLTIGNDTGTSP